MGASDEAAAGFPCAAVRMKAAEGQDLQPRDGWFEAAKHGGHDSSVAPSINERDPELGHVDGCGTRLNRPLLGDDASASR